MITAPGHAGTPDGQHHALHGDGIVDVALRVSDASLAYDLAVERGAVGVQEPTVSVPCVVEISKHTSERGSR